MDEGREGDHAGWADTGPLDPGELPPGAVDRLLADLARWTAEAAVAGAAKSRSRERWERQQAAEGARLTGIALDLAERRASVLVRTSAGRIHRGVLRAVAADFWVMAVDAGHACLLATAAVGSLRLAPSTGRPAWDGELLGDRDDVLDLRLADALALVAGDRPHVTVAVGDDRELLAGELRAVGVDVLTLRLAGHPPALAYVPLSSVTEVSILSG